MSYPDLTDEECSICGAYHTIFVCKECYDRQRKEIKKKVIKIIKRNMRHKLHLSSVRKMINEIEELKEWSIA
jgi:predicted metal-binding protein